MSSTVAPQHPTARPSRTATRTGRPDAIRVRQLRHGARDRSALGRYVDGAGRAREVVVRAGFQGSVLVIDRDAAALGDRRLVAHLGADEPRENAALVCASYLDRVRRGGCRCRPVTQTDFRAAPFADQEHERLRAGEGEAIDAAGCVYRLEALHTGMSVPELRWRRHAPPPSAHPAAIVSMREAVAALESYEPIRTLTKRALVLATDDRALSTAVVRAELTRVQHSPIVLNRRLREVTVACMKREGLSLSEIAIRCGRLKRDARGGESGETSWLARRLGLLPEGGKDTPTPWIHSNVLALIARRGLGLSPREVEVD
jgi:hypothetical protein